MLLMALGCVHCGADGLRPAKLFPESRHVRVKLSEAASGETVEALLERMGSPRLACGQSVSDAPRSCWIVVAPARVCLDDWIQANAGWHDVDPEIPKYAAFPPFKSHVPCSCETLELPGR